MCALLRPEPQQNKSSEGNDYPEEGHFPLNQGPLLPGFCGWVPVPIGTPGVALKSCCRNVSSRPRAGVSFELEGDNVTVFEAVVLDVGYLAVLVEVNGEDGAPLNPRIEEGDLLFDAGDVIPAVAAEGGLGRRISEPLLHAGLGVGADRDGGLALGIRQEAALIDDGRAAEKQNTGERKCRKAHRISSSLGRKFPRKRLASVARRALQALEQPCSSP